MINARDNGGDFFGIGDGSNELVFEFELKAGIAGGHEVGFVAVVKVSVENVVAGLGIAGEDAALDDAEALRDLLIFNEQGDEGLITFNLKAGNGE